MDNKTQSLVSCDSIDVISKSDSEDLQKKSDSSLDNLNLKKDNKQTISIKIENNLKSVSNLKKNDTSILEKIKSLPNNISKFKKHLNKVRKTQSEIINLEKIQKDKNFEITGNDNQNLNINFSIIKDPKTNKYKVIEDIKFLNGSNNEIVFEKNIPKNSSINFSFDKKLKNSNLLVEKKVEDSKSKNEKDLDKNNINLLLKADLSDEKENLFKLEKHERDELVLKKIIYPPKPYITFFNEDEKRVKTEKQENSFNTFYLNTKTQKKTLTYPKNYDNQAEILFKAKKNESEKSLSANKTNIETKKPKKLSSSNFNKTVPDDLLSDEQTYQDVIKKSCKHLQQRSADYSSSPPNIITVPSPLILLNLQKDLNSKEAKDKKNDTKNSEELTYHQQKQKFMQINSNIDSEKLRNDDIKRKAFPKKTEKVESNKPEKNNLNKLDNNKSNSIERKDSNLKQKNNLSFVKKIASNITEKIDLNRIKEKSSKKIETNLDTKKVDLKKKFKENFKKFEKTSLQKVEKKTPKKIDKTISKKVEKINQKTIDKSYTESSAKNYLDDSNKNDSSRKGFLKNYEIDLGKIGSDKTYIDKSKVNKSNVNKDDTNKDGKYTDDIIKDDNNKDYIRKNDMNKDEISKDDINKDEISKDDINKDEINKDEVNKDEVNKDEVNKDEVNKNDIDKKDIYKIDSDKSSNNKIFKSDKVKIEKLEVTEEKFKNNEDCLIKEETELNEKNLSEIKNENKIDLTEKKYPVYLTEIKEKKNETKKKENSLKVRNLNLNTVMNEEFSALIGQFCLEINKLKKLRKLLRIFKQLLDEDRFENNLKKKLIREISRLSKSLEILNIYCDECFMTKFSKNYFETRSKSGKNFLDCAKKIDIPYLFEEKFNFRNTKDFETNRHYVNKLIKNVDACDSDCSIESLFKKNEFIINPNLCLKKIRKNSTPLNNSIKEKKVNEQNVNKEKTDTKSSLKTPAILSCIKSFPFFIFLIIISLLVFSFFYYKTENNENSKIKCKLRKI